MQRLSRRQIAAYAVDEMADGRHENLAARLAAALIENHKAGQAGELMQDIAYELEERGLAIRANVSSASSLSKNLEAEIRKFITTQTKVANVTIDESVDSGLIGGVRIETARRSWDETIKRRLTDIREAF
jgi:F0F1-type ATP synthase delta subunit